MFKNYKQLCKFIAVLFKLIEKTPKINTIEIKGYTRRDIDEIIYQCIKAGYIVNVKAWRDGNGTPHFDNIGTPHVSLTGYQFLNTLRSDVALAKARRADIKGWIALVISILTFLIYFIEQYQSITEFFK